MHLIVVLFLSEYNVHYLNSFPHLYDCLAYPDKIWTLIECAQSKMLVDYRMVTVLSYTYSFRITIEK